MTGTLSASSQRRDSFLSLCGYGAYAASQWGIVTIIARSQGPSVLGFYVLALSLTAPLFMFTNMSLMSALASDSGGSSFDTYLALRLVGSGVSLFASVAIGLAVGHRESVLVIIIFVAFYKFTESFADISQGELARQRKFTAIARSMLLRGALVLGAAASLLFGASLAAALCAGALLQLTFWWLHDRRSHRSGAPKTGERKISKSSLNRVLKVGLPLGLVSLLLSLQSSIPRLSLERATDPATLGIFAGIAYIGVGGRLVSSAFGLSALPRLGRAASEGDGASFSRLFWKMQSVAFGFGIVGILASVALGKWLLEILYGPAWSDYSDILVLTMISVSLAYHASFSQDALTALRVQRPKIAVLSISLAVTWIACEMLAQRTGIFGVAIAVILGGLTETILTSAVLWWFWRRSLSRT